ncbi:PI-PLC X domain-containing protein 1-like isoform X2 [Conger conger]|uniref:PI-PLC X domain-containing protein 1-like isoform X2 n=1 Tax=Conger conger TaxID=82655 RepID=UPI002A5A86E0|nr:PI-PLC X domain-containing protein 1-like isoform X2 [Conger conger]
MALSTVNDQNCEDWMSRLSPKLWNIPLYNLAIPGSHDTMSYCLDISSPLVRSESQSFRLVDGLFYCLTRPIIYKWTTTQESDVVEQLNAGIRYFDLRIASKQHDSSGDLYFTHVIYTSAKVLETMEKIAVWLDSHPKEIVILACSHFEGLSEKCHERFILNLRRIFGRKLCPSKAPGPAVLRGRGRSQTPGTLARHSVLVGKPAHCPGSHHLPGPAEGEGTPRGLLRVRPEPDGRKALHRAAPLRLPAEDQPGEPRVSAGLAEAAAPRPKL